MNELEQRDLAVLKRLEELGSDLSKPHQLDFFLYFPSEESAKLAAKKIENEGYIVKANPEASPWWKRLFSKPLWSVSTTKSMIPTKGAVLEISGWFNEIAQDCGGEYDGWGTEVTE